MSLARPGGVDLDGDAECLAARGDGIAAGGVENVEGVFGRGRFGLRAGRQQRC